VANLFAMLGVSARALEAHRFGLDVAGQNIANVNTPGYSRRIAHLQALAPLDRWSAGGGVAATGLQAVRDAFIAHRLRGEISRLAGHEAGAQVLGMLEVGLGAPGTSIGAKLEDLFDAFAAVADDPTSLAARRVAIEAGATLAATFREVSSQLSAGAREIDSRLRAATDQVNGLAQRVAALNREMASARPGEARTEQLRDELDLALEQLAQLIDVRAVTREDGGIDVELDGGVALVLGGTARGVSSVSTTGGHVALSVDGTALGGSVGGALGTLIRTRDEVLPEYLAQLDQLAHDVATRINARHQAGFDLTGATGGAFFVPPGAVDGASARLSMSGALLAPGGEAGFAASASGAAGDNENARRLVAVRDERALLGGTATVGEAWAALASAVGADVAAARDAATTGAEAVEQLLNLRDSISGVSLDEEAAEMMRFQRGYEANARVFGAIDELLDVLMGLVRA
jgi:flagellar hook-associated protein 1 FlgK